MSLFSSDEHVTREGLVNNVNIGCSVYRSRFATVAHKVLAERILYAGYNLLYLKTNLESIENGSGNVQNGPGATSLLLKFIRNITKTAPEAASRSRLKYW